MGDKMSLPERKCIRLKDYNYAENGAYFVTICTRNREQILSDIVGEGLCALPHVILAPIGEIVKTSIEYIGKKYEGVFVDKYVIMPDHIHLLIRFMGSKSEGNENVSLQNIIRNFKSFTSRQFGGILWQRSFYDHIIRSEQDYNEIWQYIENNAYNWLLRNEKINKCVTIFVAHFLFFDVFWAGGHRDPPLRDRL